MNITSTYSLLPLISSIFVIALGFFIWIKRIKEKLHILFFAYCFNISIWLFGTFKLFNAITEQDQIWWDRFIYIGVVFIPIFLYHFGLIYTNILNQKILLYVGYPLAIFFLILSRTDYFVKDLYQYRWGVHTVAQQWHTVFLIFFFFYFTAFFINLIKHYRNTKNERKKQVKYLLIAFAILDIIGPLAYLPAYGIPIFPIIFLSGVPFALIVGYAIIKHNVLDVKIIATEIFVFLLSLINFVEIPFSQNTTELVLRLCVFVVIVIFSIFLLKGVYNEVEQRKQLKELLKIKSEFLTIASHQLRTPTSIARGMLSMIVDGSIKGKQKDDFINKTFQSVNRLERIIQDLLSASELEGSSMKLECQPVNIEEIIQNVIQERAQMTKEKNLTLEYKSSKIKLPQILSDKLKTVEIIGNLVDNAIFYTEKGGITIWCEVIPDKKVLEIHIKDTGIGITNNDRERIFGQFQRGERSLRIHPNGSGLGLFIVKKIVEACDGIVQVKSEGENKGSEFILTLHTAEK